MSFIYCLSLWGGRSAARTSGGSPADAPSHGNQAVTRACDLRRHATDTERKLWYRLRELKRLGYRFRRQAPFRSYVPDFVEHAAALVVELDGSQHGLPEQARKDEQRDRTPALEGYLVLRFPNNEVFANLDGVVEVILRQTKLRYPDPHPIRFADRPPHPAPPKGSAAASETHLARRSFSGGGKGEV